MPSSDRMLSDNSGFVTQKKVGDKNVTYTASDLMKEQAWKDTKAKEKQAADAKSSQFQAMEQADTNWQNDMSKSIGKFKEDRSRYDNYLNSEQTGYLNRQNRYENDFQSKQQGLQAEAEQQGKDATKTYSTIQPKLQGLMEQSYNNAQQAMSLKDAGDANNSVAVGQRNLYANEGAAQRDLYNQEAEAQIGQNAALQEKYGPNYEQNIKGERNQGYQDYGVLAALGNQATQAGGGAPMTVGQQMAFQAANQRAAGEAFNNTQKRISSLKDMSMAQKQALANRQMDTSGRLRSQGIDSLSSLRSKGLDVGREESAAQYERGQRAGDTAASRANEYFNTNAAYGNQMQGLRSERGGYDTNILGSKGRLNDSQMSVAQEQFNRSQGNNREDFGIDTGFSSDISNKQKMRAAARLGDQAQMQALAQEQANARGAAIQAEQNRNAQMTGAVVGAIGTGVGAYYGGPAGAAAGGAGGNYVGQAAAGGQSNFTPTPVQRPTNYYNTSQQRPSYIGQYNGTT